MKTYVISSVMLAEYRIFEYYLTSLLENQGSLSLILLSFCSLYLVMCFKPSNTHFILVLLVAEVSQASFLS